MKRLLLLFSRIIISAIISTTFVLGQTATDGDYRTKQTGNWSSASTWQVRASSSWSDAANAPTSSNNVYIQTGHTVTIDATSSCLDLHIHTSGVVTIGTNTLQVYGKIRAYTGTAVTTTGADGIFYSDQTSSNNPVAAMITTSGGGVLKFVGNTRNITNTGEWAATGGTSHSTEFGLTSGQTSTLQTGYKSASILVSSGTIDMGTNRLAPDNGTTGQGNVTINSGAILQSAQSAGNQVISRTVAARGGTLTVNSDGKLILTGSSPRIDMNSISFNGIVEYSRSGTQTLVTKGSDVSSADPSFYTNLILSGTSTKTLGLNTTVNGTLSLQGTASLALSTFTLTYGGSSTLEYAGSAAQTSTDTELSSSGGPNSLIIDNSSGVTLHAARTINGMLDLISGALNNSLSTLTLGNGATIIRIGGSLSAVPTFGTSVDLIYYEHTSLITTSFELPSSSSVLRDLTINSSNGVTLGGTATVNRILILTSGNITTTNSNLLTLGSSATVSGGSSSSFVSGPMAHTWTTSTATKTYPLGKGSTYRPLEVNLTTPASPVIMAEVFNSDAGGTKGSLNVISTIRYYQTSLISGTAASGGTVKITFGADDGVTDNSTLVVAQSATVNGTYTTLGRSTSDATSVTSASYNPSLGAFLLLGDTGTNPLPVELTSFTRDIVGKKVKLYWQTATEVNNYGFEVQRLTVSNQLLANSQELNANGWSKIGFVEGHGNSNSPKNYSCTDEPFGGKEFKYRLKQIDFDGTFEYSNELTAVFEDVTSFALEQNYPNPFNPVTKIGYTIPQRSTVKLRVYNMLAQLETELVNESQEAGHYQVIFNGSNLPSGTYFYKLEAGKFVEVRKFLLIK